ncbi:hypothetical protein FRC12_012765 [Ceratobasidium sp. 428]|nr:hypothetical protein FRC12_012765 [Ceratobasidium sp. 428]
MIAKASLEEQYIYVKTLIEEGDFLNLMGRILLWFVRFDCPEMLLEPAAEQTLKFGAVITRFTMSIQSVHKRVDDRIPYIIGSIMDGMKVARFLGEAIITCPPDNRELYNYLATVAVIWDRIRGLIPNMSSLCCVNPVCGKANAQWICTGCRNAFYCGRRCQKRHWRYRGVGHPHWLECETQSMQGIEPLLEYGKVLGPPHE